jgi:hypothetical protein
MSIQKFLHFGCWNKGGCDLTSINNKTSLSDVMIKINQFAETPETKPDFILVAGDNYYPKKKTSDKGGKIKKMNFEELLSGFDCLPKNIECNIILGNHDLETDVYVGNEETPNKCNIINSEINISNRNDNINLKLFNFKKIGNSTLILMIDSTMYDPISNLFLPCYKKILKNTIYDTNDIDEETETYISNLTMNDIRKIQKDYIENIIINNLNNLKNIIIVAHHPITCYKFKKDNIILVDTPGQGLTDFLYNTIYLNSINDAPINYYYLCADLHQYQIGTIKIKPQDVSDSMSMIIKQYIVGTGGTDLDENPFKYDITERNQTIQFMPILQNTDSKSHNITYIVSKEHAKIANIAGSKYGFLECHNVDDQLQFRFIDVNGGQILENEYKEYMSEQPTILNKPILVTETSELLSGGRNKKYKNKNLNIKKLKTKKLKTKKLKIKKLIKLNKLKTKTKKKINKYKYFKRFNNKSNKKYKSKKVSIKKYKSKNIRNKTKR